MLTQLSKSNKRQARPPQPTALVALDFDKGKNSREESDKIRFDEYDKAMNVYFVKKNARVRKGTATVTSDEDFLDIAIAKHSTGNKLFAMKKDTADSKITKVDRTTYVQTDLLTGISGQDSFSFDSGGDTFYLCNGTDTEIQVVQSAETATSLAISQGVPVALTLCSNRLWVANNLSNLYYSEKSDGEITAFTITNAHSTGGLTTTGIDKILALGSHSVYVVAMGKSRIEVHMAPEFAGGETTFGDAPNTFVAGFDGYGIDSMKGFKIVGGILYFQNKGGFYWYIIGSQTPPQIIDRNGGEHQTLTYTGTAMGYDPDTQLIYTACGKNSSQNNYGIFYKIVEVGDPRYNSFSNFNNIDAKSFAFDDDNKYFLQEYFGVIKEITGTSDDGVEIDGELLSSNSFNGDVKFKKNAKEMYLDIESDGAEDVYYSFYVDPKEGSTQPANFTYLAQIGATGGQLTSSPGAYGLTPWGLTGYLTSGSTYRFKVWQARKINKKYSRGQCGVKFSTVNDLQIRGLGWFFTRTVQRVGDKEFL